MWKKFLMKIENEIKNKFKNKNEMKNKKENVMVFYIKTNGEKPYGGRYFLRCECNKFWSVARKVEYAKRRLAKLYPRRVSTCTAFGFEI